MLTPRPRRRDRPRGFTLVEVILGLVLLGLCMAAIARVLVNQRRFFAESREVIAVHAAEREITTQLPAALRGISSAGGDIYAMSDSALDFRFPAGSSVVCTINGGRSSITVPPVSLASQASLSSWLTTPQAGDSVFIYDDGSGSGLTDDSWQLYVITAVPGSGSCPTTTGFTTTAAEAAAGVTLNISPALTATTVVGAPVRFFRRARYKLYQPSAGSGWYLGYSDCPGGVCRAMAPVSGPFLAYGPAGASGLTFTYRDSTGAVTATPTTVARIDIVARAQTRIPIRGPGRKGTYLQDSLATTVALRNRS